MSVLNLTQNNRPLNRVAQTWLKEPVDKHYLNVLQLAAQGLESGATGEWPDRDRAALENQVNLLFSWKPENLMAWLLGNPNGPESEEQEQEMWQSVANAATAKEAAAIVLSAIYSRMQADNPALQPAASE